MKTFLLVLMLLGLLASANAKSVLALAEEIKDVTALGYQAKTVIAVFFWTG